MSMAYCTHNDYTSIYIGSNSITDEEFAPLAERASDIIDELTFGRIERDGVDSYPDWVQRRIIKACCAQIDHLFQLGIEVAISGNVGGSYSIGSTSISGGSGDGSVSRVSPIAYRLLATTGLTHSAVSVVC